MGAQLQIIHYKKHPKHF